MIGIDTNVLVRYITQDDLAQSQIATKLMENNASKGIFVNNIVLCELVWVLKRAYKYPKSGIIEVLKTILTSVEFCFEDHRLLWLVVADFEKSSADFSDVLIGKINKERGCEGTYTFDREASSLSFIEKL